MSNPFRDLGHQIEHGLHDVTNKVVDIAESAAAQTIVDSAIDYLSKESVVVAEEVAEEAIVAVV